MKRVFRIKKAPKSVKGMTLVEIIISVAVFAVIALILVQVGGTVNTLVKRSNHVNKKTSIESPMIENADACLTVTHEEGYDDAAQTKRNYKKDKEKLGALGGCLEAYTGINRSEKASPLKVTLEYDGTPVNMNVAVFSATPAIAAVDKDSTASSGDLKYVYVSTWLTEGGNMLWVDDHPLAKAGEDNDDDDDSDKIKPALPDDETVGDEEGGNS